MSFEPLSLTLDNLRSNGEPAIFETSTAVWSSELTASFEAASGRTLYPDQTETLLLEPLAYALSLEGAALQTAFLANLAVWADGARLDDIAAQAGIFRRLASPAVADVSLTLPETRQFQVIAPAGTVLPFGFTLDSDVVFAAGTTTAVGTVTAVTPGTALNGIAAGNLTGTITATGVAGVEVTTTSVTGGGTDAETDEEFRKIVVDAPEAFDRRGGWGGYGLQTRLIDPSIVDVAVDRPRPGEIDIWVLADSDIPPNETTRTAIRFRPRQDTVRPMGDFVTVRAPIPVTFAPVLSVRYDPSEEPDRVRNRVRTAVTEAFAGMRRPLLSSSERTEFAPETGRLGAQVSPGAVIAAVSGVPGVIDVTIDSGLVFTDLSFFEFPVLGGVTINLVDGTDA